MHTTTGPRIWIHPPQGSSSCCFMFTSHVQHMPAWRWEGTELLAIWQHSYIGMWLHQHCFFPLYNIWRICFRILKQSLLEWRWFEKMKRDGCHQKDLSMSWWTCMGLANLDTGYYISSSQEKHALESLSGNLPQVVLETKTGDSASCRVLQLKPKGDYQRRQVGCHNRSSLPQQ